MKLSNPMFRRISTKIALQFMTFVFLLFLINGAIFLGLDFENARRQSRVRLLRDMQAISDHMPPDFSDLPQGLPPVMRQRVRVLDAAGKTLLGGSFFEDIPFKKIEGFYRHSVENEPVTIFTTPVTKEGELVGYIQVIDIERFQRRDLPFRAFIYLLVSILITALTFIVGKLFAALSLRPAAQTMKRLEQFTQDASHEIRTPLAALNSSLDLALKSGKYKEGIVSAKEDVKQITTLADRLLELARLDQFAVRVEKMDLSSLMETIIRKHQPLAAEKHIVIESSVAPGITVETDPALAQQVISNLLSNAIKFSKSVGGIIHVRLKKDQLSIEDTGIGIAAADVPRIFDRFYQAESSRSSGGLGLGLALVKRIVDLLGWSIGVKSVEGKGSIFTIRFGK